MKAAVAISVFIAAAVILPGCRKEPSPPAGTSAPSNFTIRALTAERSGDHIHLTITVHLNNPGTNPLILTPPAVQLWIGNEKPAAPFIAPGLEPEVIAPGAESEGCTHWWLAAPELSHALELEIAGARQTVKTADYFVLDSLVEGQPAQLAFPVWKPLP